ncbi:MAG: type II toxin-antitoxin system Phd/YefM family antitoxin [Bifidobacteriaceae bacterium]|jgi:antitoxin (DNA-binding transcriptional repressor) of toxin-antitoxin stability system|nr:type II toxin-antitoxin system Phd/YefM family antitoxin [Bifidobacteriaceae bacterium]
MDTISVGALRQNPSAALAAVESGRTYLVTRHRHPIAQLAPVASYWPTGRDVTAFAEDYRRRGDGQAADGFTPEWLEEQRSGSDISDPWQP